MQVKKKPRNNSNVSILYSGPLATLENKRPQSPGPGHFEAVFLFLQRNCKEAEEKMEKKADDELAERQVDGLFGESGMKRVGNISGFTGDRSRQRLRQDGSSPLLIHPCYRLTLQGYPEEIQKYDIGG